MISVHVMCNDVGTKAGVDDKGLHHHVDPIASLKHIKHE